MSIAKDITGQKFNNLTAIGFDHKYSGKRRASYWLFKCSICGQEKIMNKSSVITGHAKTCGCRPKGYKHGMRWTKFYKIWRCIHERCLYKRNDNYYLYGGRGIKVCDRWLKFENFRDDMYQSYLEHTKEFGEKETTIEREDNNLGYFRDNCRWATMKEQANNRRDNHLITYKNKTKNITQWAKELNISRDLIYSRIKIGWSPIKALTTKIIKKYV